MESIKRVGPPKATGADGTYFTWEIPLNTTPPDRWPGLFVSECGEYSSMCTPHGVEFQGAVARFRSDEARVPSWIDYIDKWAVRANEAYAVLVQREQQQRAAAQARAAEERRKIDEATEKFKNL